MTEIIWGDTATVWGSMIWGGMGAVAVTGPASAFSPFPRVGGYFAARKYAVSYRITGTVANRLQAAAWILGRVSNSFRVQTRMMGQIANRAVYGFGAAGTVANRYVDGIPIRGHVRQLIKQIRVPVKDLPKLLGKPRTIHVEKKQQ